MWKSRHALFLFQAVIVGLSSNISAAPPLSSLDVNSFNDVELALDDILLVPDDVEPLQIVSAVSRRRHGDLAFDIDLLWVNGQRADYEPINNPGGIVAVEPRNGGVQEVWLEFNRNVPQYVSVRVNNAFLHSVEHHGTRLKLLLDTPNGRMVTIFVDPYGTSFIGPVWYPRIFVGVLEGDCDGDGSLPQRAKNHEICNSCLIISGK